VRFKKGKYNNSCMAKILLVEDDPMIGEIYHRKLSGSGYETEVCVDGLAAKEKMKMEVYDLVFLDVVLPGMDGIDILKEISEEGKKPLLSPVVVCSNLNDTENQNNAFLFGASGFLVKSQFDISKLPKEADRFIRQAQARKVNEARFEAKSVDIPVRDEDRKHILVVEDEEIFAELFSGYLEQEGFRVTVARTGAKALDVLHEQSADLVVTDILLPTMYGDELVEVMRNDEQLRDIPIVVISASAMDDNIERVKRFGVEDIFIKTDITPSELMHRIKEILKVQ
jgi:CheY-like chemotaxis protein